MKSLKTATLAALTLSCATLAFSPAAHSANFLDFLRGKKTAKQEVLVPADQDLGLNPVRPVTPLPRVSGPRYFTYKAEALRLVGVGKFAPAIESASAENTGAGTVQTDAMSGSVAMVSPQPVMVADNPRALLSDVKVRAGNNVATAIETFYAAHEGLLWVDANGVTAKARAAMTTLSDVEKVGLDPADYAVVDPSDTISSVDSATRQRQLMQFEIELSVAALSFIEDTKRGRIDPNKISGYHDFKRKAVNLYGAINNIALSGDITAYLESRNPSSAEFVALMNELAAIKAANVTDQPKIAINLTTLLKPGQSSPELANIVEAIRLRGSDQLKVDQSVTLASYQGTPAYTDDLVELVKAFQLENGLKGDGIVGRGSIRVMLGGDNSSDKTNKLIIAMEQRRWLPDHLGARHVFINQPAFLAYYHNNDREEFSMRVVVGSPANQTYFFHDEIETVEYNPYWGVPRSIIVNEMLPKLREDASYLDRLGYEVSVSGQAVSSTSVDWFTTSAVDVRQPPGSSNALGELKILFPNAHSIYMHDTPSKSFFKRDMRALSHGCVRLVDPKKMAAAVMNITQDEISAQIAMGQNRAVSVPERIPVYVSYFTAWPNKDGVVEYFDDVYSRDMYMNRAFEAITKARRAQS